MKTQVCEMLGIELPIFAFSHCRDVVAEVSKAGGMGVLGVSGFSPEQLEQELAWIDEHIEGRPYAVDILIPNRYEQSAARLQTLPPLPEVNQRFLGQLCDDAGMAPLPAGESQRMVQEYLERLHMTPESAEELIEISLRHPLVKLVVNALGCVAVSR